uniref:Uncharacterized protein n=1 Tax=Haemonchus contortus TaxID=6289 RepID=A0A7I4Y053_HAECO
MQHTVNVDNACLLACAWTGHSQQRSSSSAGRERERESAWNGEAVGVGRRPAPRSAAPIDRRDAQACGALDAVVDYTSTSTLRVARGARPGWPPGDVDPSESESVGRGPACSDSFAGLSTVVC